MRRSFLLGAGKPAEERGGSGIAPLGGRGRNRPWGAPAAGTAALGSELIWKALGLIASCVWSWGTQQRADQLPRTGDRFRGGTRAAGDRESRGQRRRSRSEGASG